MDKNIILPLFPDSKDVPLPGITYKIRVYDAYSKELFNYLQKDNYFFYCITSRNFNFVMV